MTERDQVRLLFHGSIVLLVGLLSGVPMGQAITGGWGEEVVRAWRVAHVGLAAGGLMLIALAPAAGLLTLGPRGARWFVAAVLAAAYGAVVALPLGAITGVRGLEPHGAGAQHRRMAREHGARARKPIRHDARDARRAHVAAHPGVSRRLYGRRPGRTQARCQLTSGRTSRQAALPTTSPLA